METFFTSLLLKKNNHRFERCFQFGLVYIFPFRLVLYFPSGLYDPFILFWLFKIPESILNWGQLYSLSNIISIPKITEETLIVEIWCTYFSPHVCGIPSPQVYCFLFGCKLLIKIHVSSRDTFIWQSSMAVWQGLWTPAVRPVCQMRFVKIYFSLFWSFGICC